MANMSREMQRFLHPSLVSRLSAVLFGVRTIYDASVRTTRQDNREYPTANSLARFEPISLPLEMKVFPLPKLLLPIIDYAPTEINNFINMGEKNHLPKEEYSKIENIIKT